MSSQRSHHVLQVVNSRGRSWDTRAVSSSRWSHASTAVAGGMGSHDGHNLLNQLGHVSPGQLSRRLISRIILRVLRSFPHALLWRITACFPVCFVMSQAWPAAVFFFALGILLVEMLRIALLDLDNSFGIMALQLLPAWLYTCINSIYCLLCWPPCLPRLCAVYPILTWFKFY